MKINLLNLQKKVPIPAGKIKKLIREILKKERARAAGWINICFVGNAGIKKFNAKFLNHRGDTDVLSFNLGNIKDKNLILADIMISAQKAKSQSAAYGTTAGYELSLYACHGLLHILGYDDRTPEQSGLMRKKESQYVH